VTAETGREDLFVLDVIEGVVGLDLAHGERGEREAAHYHEQVAQAVHRLPLLRTAGGSGSRSAPEPNRYDTLATTLI
jgi:hypothetical protein